MASFGDYRNQRLDQNPANTDQPVSIPLDDDNGVTMEDGALKVDQPDGSVVIDLFPKADKPSEDKGFYANLAEDIEKGELQRIAEEIYTGVESDNQSRAEWLETRAEGLKLLGLKLEPPRGDVSTNAAPLEGMSTFRHPLLLEAVLRGQANARGELLPAEGPVKVRTFGAESADTMSAANDLEADMNYDLTVAQSHYYPDTDRMLFYVYFGGCGFKKVFHCPIRNRPVSESVDSSDIIVSNAATDLKNSRRVTHVIKMRPATLRRMQIAKAYRKVELTPPAPEKVDPVKWFIAEAQGTRPEPQRPEDYDYTIYETCIELDIKGFEHKDKGESTGLMVPYKVTMEKESRQILEIRRNWEKSDEMCLPKDTYVKYPYVQGMGFYDIGLVHILGNTTVALTAMTREAIDLGMFNNFPGFLYTETVARQLTNEMRVPPGAGMKIQTGGGRLADNVMPLPYKNLDAAFVSLAQAISADGQRVGGTAEISVGEGRADVPVGTTLAMIEQATKIESSVHRRQHQAQAEEFQLLKKLFKEDPESLIRSNPRSKIAKRFSSLSEADRKQKIIELLDNSDLVPVADPNTPTRLHRIMLAVALQQLASSHPGLYDQKAVDTLSLSIIGIQDPESLFNQNPQPPPPDPRMLAVQAKAQAEQQSSQLQAQEIQMKTQTAMAQLQDSAADRASREKLEQLKILLETKKIQEEGIIHARDMQNDSAQVGQKMQLDAVQGAQDIHMDRARQQAALQMEREQHDAAMRRAEELHRQKLSHASALSEATVEHKRKQAAAAPKKKETK